MAKNQQAAQTLIRSGQPKKATGNKKTAAANRAKQQAAKAQRERQAILDNKTAKNGVNRCEIRANVAAANLRLTGATPFIASVANATNKV